MLLAYSYPFFLVLFNPHRCPFRSGWALFRRMVMYHYCVMHVRNRRLEVLLHWLNFTTKSEAPDAHRGWITSLCIKKHATKQDKKIVFEPLVISFNFGGFRTLNLWKWQKHYDCSNWTYLFVSPTLHQLRVRSIRGKKSQRGRLRWQTNLCRSSIVKGPQNVRSRRRYLIISCHIDAYQRFLKKKEKESLNLVFIYAEFIKEDAATATTPPSTARTRGDVSD